MDPDLLRRRDQVSLVQGELMLSLAVLSFERQQDAERAVDALWALKTAPR